MSCVWEAERGVGWEGGSVLVLRSCELHPELGPRTCDLEVSMIHTCSTLRENGEAMRRCLHLGEESPEKSSGVS